jgi:hypothetical protein
MVDDTATSAEIEELAATLIEIKLQDIGEMMLGAAGMESQIVPEKESSKDGTYRFWINTPMGFMEIEKMYAQLGDCIAAEETPDVTN